MRWAKVVKPDVVGLFQVPMTLARALAVVFTLDATHHVRLMTTHALDAAAAEGRRERSS
jgi:hypothetical protein